MGQRHPREAVLSAELSTELGTKRAPVILKTRRKLRKRRAAQSSQVRPSQASRERLITLDHLDRRTHASRRAFELIEMLENERGGADHLTEAVRQLCQRAAVLAAIIEDHETRWIAGESIDLAGYLSAIGVQRRVLISLGLERQAPRDVTPPLSTYLRDKSEEGADGD